MDLVWPKDYRKKFWTKLEANLSETAFWAHTHIHIILFWFFRATNVIITFMYYHNIKLIQKYPCENNNNIYSYRPVLELRPFSRYLQNHKKFLRDSKKIYIKCWKMLRSFYCDQYCCFISWCRAWVIPWWSYE